MSNPPTPTTAAASKPCTFARPPPSPLGAGFNSQALPSPHTPHTPTSATPVGDRPKTRARDLLRAHYGLGAGVPQPSGKPMDPMDLDSPAFDAKAYYEQLITTSSLPTLLKKENELISEMRQLESERQSLVYNHHHELIAASDTIAAMKARAEGLDADLDLLKAAFSEISRLGAEVAVEQYSHTNPGRESEHRSEEHLR